MITVACPNCNVENSALSRRCSSCGSELIIEGYVRCDNCRVLTLEKLEFCELCGSYLASAAAITDPIITSSTRQNASKADATHVEPQTVSNPEDGLPAREGGEEHSHAGQIDQSEKDRGESADQPDSDIPAWLLDVDAALKMSNVPDSRADDSDSPSGEDTLESGKGEPQSAEVYDKLLRRLDDSHTSKQPSESSEPAEWLNVLDGEDDLSEKGNVEDLSVQSQPAASSANREPPGEEGEVDPPIDQTEEQPPEVVQKERKRSGTTQPLDPRGKLLGVPKQLAGTDLPSWLSDQLQRPEDDIEEYVDDIELPVPVRATYLAPVGPDVEPREPDEQDTVLDPSFEKWLQDLSDEPVTPDWMVEGEGPLEATFESDSVQAGAETPQWLHDIHEAEGDTAQLLGIEEKVEDTGRFAGIKGAIQIEPAMAAPLIRARATEYKISEEQQQQIAILEAIVHTKPVKQKPKTVELPSDSSVGMRVLLAVALIFVILIATVVPSSTEWLQDSTLPPVTEQTQQFYDQVMLAAGQPVLVAFDYTPAMSGEINPIAKTVLGQLADNDSPVITVSQSAAGTEVAAIIAQDIDGLEWQQPIYIPGEAVGLRSLAECLSEAAICTTLFGKELPTEVQESLSTVALIVILTSESNSFIDWIEQVGVQLEETSLIAGIAQLLGPVAIPYSSSGQLSGIIVGFPDTIAYQQDLLGIEGEEMVTVSGYTLAIWIVALFLLAGTVYYAVTGLNISISGKEKDS